MIISLVFLFAIAVLAYIYHRDTNETSALVGVSCIPGLLIPIILYCSIYYVNNYSKEYWCGYAVSVVMHEGYYTTTTTTTNGVTTTSTSYTAPSYVLIDINGSKNFLYDNEYRSIAQLWGYKPAINFDNGMTYTYNWKGDKVGKICMTSVHTYLNKTQNEGSLYKYDKMIDKQADEYGLYHRNTFKNSYEVDFTYGCYDPAFNNRVSDFNARYGKKHQIIVNFLIYNSPDIDTAIQQETYWKGGNKNELNICYGINSDREILWCKVFSWSDGEKLKTDVQNLQTVGSKLNLDKTLAYLEDNINRWERKQFKDFNYISTKYPTWATITIIIIDGLYFIGIIIYVNFRKAGNPFKSNYQNRLRFR